MALSIAKRVKTLWQKAMICPSQQLSSRRRPERRHESLTIRDTGYSLTLRHLGTHDNVVPKTTLGRVES